MAKNNDLSEATAISNDDIMRLRTTGGIDKKITGENLRDTLVTQSLDVNTTQSISLSSYTTNLTILGTQTSAITLTLTNVLNDGRELKIINSTAFLMTVTLGGETYEISEDGKLYFTSDSSAMIRERELLTTITEATTYKIKKGDRGKIIICEPTEDIDLTITNSGTDERDYITVVNNSVYTITVKDSTYSYWLDTEGQKVDFRIDYDGDLRRSPGWGLIYVNDSPSSQYILDTALLNSFDISKQYKGSVSSSGTTTGAVTNFGPYPTVSGTYRGSNYDGGSSYSSYEVSNSRFNSGSSTWYWYKILQWYNGF